MPEAQNSIISVALAQPVLNSHQPFKEFTPEEKKASPKRVFLREHNGTWYPEFIEMNGHYITRRDFNLLVNALRTGFKIHTRTRNLRAKTNTVTNTTSTTAKP